MTSSAKSIAIIRGVIPALMLITLLPSAYPAADDPTANARVAEAYGKLPLSFVENQGQLDDRVRYVIRGPQASAFFTDTGVTFDLLEPLPEDRRHGSRPGQSLRRHEPLAHEDEKEAPLPRKRAVLRMEFRGASPECRVEGLDKLPGKVNYLIGNDPFRWHTEIPTYKGVIYRDVWPGIDVIFRGDRRQLKYDIRVNPEADISLIRLRYEGAEKIWLDESGDLHVKTAVTTFRENVPGIYQEENGRRIPRDTLDPQAFLLPQELSI